jgi:hypothetical protein
MKTAMQEAIELVKKYDSRKIPFKVLLFNLEQLLEKEKEQILDAVDNGRNTIGDDFDWSFEYDDGEEYYNQTFNQDRITISETRRSVEEIRLLKKQSEGVGWWWKGRE